MRFEFSVALPHPEKPIVDARLRPGLYFGFTGTKNMVQGMRMAPSKRLLVTLLLLLPIPSAFGQQETKKPDDPALAEVSRIVQEGQKEIQAFRQRGGKENDPNHPALKWSQELWKLHERYRGERPGSLAAGAAIRMLLRAERFTQANSWADQLAPDDPAWEEVFPHLQNAANTRNDHSYVLNKLKELLGDPRSEKLRPGLYFYLGQAHKWAGDNEAGIAAYETVLQLAPGTAWARGARASIEELQVLAIGKPAPAVSARTREGRDISLYDFRGKAVLLIFWAST
jgi:tetratricopeptide (TPR) repeat protein